MVKNQKQSNKCLTKGLMLHTRMMKMTASMTETIFTDGNSPVRQGSRDGFEEQKVLLSRISRELDDYFSLRTISRL
jgi:hypothetical protein